MEQKIMLNKRDENKSVKMKSKTRQIEINNISMAFVKEKKALRMPRTKKYIKLMKDVDQLSDKDKDIIEMVQAMPVNNQLLGILSECCITGCIIHAIDKYGNVIEHFKNLSEMPLDLQKGYEVFIQHKGCSSVEVYTFSFCVIYSDGTVKIIERG